MSHKYRDYFNIDPEYFPQVDEKLIDQGKVDWTKFYPHTTFINLLKTVVRVLERKDKRSLWVEGSYGTGKSHAVLTLKKLLEATDEELQAYFSKYDLDADLLNKYRGLQEPSKPILTVHRYGASSIHGDRDLILAVQESIRKTLRERGIAHLGEESLKDAVLRWLEKPANKNYFRELISGEYSVKFHGDTVDTLIKKMNEMSGASLAELMRNIFYVAEKEGITALNLDIDGLIRWIKSVIDENHLKAIVFIWDEFTEYFTHNRNALTGFQRLAEMSATEPFYLCIVTHKSKALFGDVDRDKSKILDRFVDPTCKLELPENIAFQLIAQALEKKRDSQILREWERAATDLNCRLEGARKLVKNCGSKITDEELKDILPIHPYTALLLKHISSGYASDQRSMFDFIRNDRGEEIRGFQWFIDHFGPEDKDPLLTIDMLWDFFYEKGKTNLPLDVRSILDVCPQVESQLTQEEIKVLRTVLLLQAISQRVGDDVEWFVPDEKNVTNAYEGSDLENGEACRIAHKLVRDGILYLKQLKKTTQFAAVAGKNSIDTVAFEEHKKSYIQGKTSLLFSMGTFQDFMTLSAALGMRFVIKLTASDTIVSTLRSLGQSTNNTIPLVISFAKNEEESVSITKLIRDKIATINVPICFVDTGATPLGPQALSEYAECMAYSRCYAGNDNKIAADYEKRANEILIAWKRRILDGEFTVYSNETPEGERAANSDALNNLFVQINLKKYPLSLENFICATGTMYSSSLLKLGVECGANQATSGAFRSAVAAMKLETALGGAWKVDRYWEAENSHHPIVMIKQELERIIADKFKENGRISIVDIYSIFAVEPYGFMPCNLTAFILGFLLKEYAVESYQWSDDQTTEPMSILKLKEMVDEVIKLQKTPNPRYKDKYIVATTDEEKAFNQCASKVFKIPIDQCVTIEQTRRLIRGKMRQLVFPTWCTKYVLEQVPHRTDSETLEHLIELLGGVANDQNLAGGKSDTDIALEIGKICKANPTSIDDLANLLTKENCRQGMREYLNIFEDGHLVHLAQAVGDNDAYLSVLQKKLDADSATWLWNRETVEQQIHEVIEEYGIILNSQAFGICATSIGGVIREWSERTRWIKLPYELLENLVGDARPFLTSLNAIRHTDSLSGPQRQEFLSALQERSTAFKTFYDNQLQYFQQTCSFSLNELASEDIESIFAPISEDVFLWGKSEYLKLVDDKVEKYKKTLGKTKLRELWMEKTGTESPRKWSQQHAMPILCMIPDSEEAKAREVFSTIHRTNPEPGDVEKAMEYLENATFFESLNDEALCEEAVRKKLIRDFATLISDVKKIRCYLLETLGTDCDPYDWLTDPKVQQKIREYAQAMYDRKGCDEAMKIIESMMEQQLKVYLRRLVKGNMIVGMEIIRDKRGE